MKKKFIILKKKRKVIEVNCAESTAASHGENYNIDTLSIIKNQLISDLNKMDLLIENHFIK